MQYGRGHASSLQIGLSPYGNLSETVELQKDEKKIGDDEPLPWRLSSRYHSETFSV